LNLNTKKVNVRFRYSLIVLMTATLLAACDRAPKYSEVPSISFNKIAKYRVYSPINSSYIDSLAISINFQDGDGNLGNVDQNATPNFIAEIYLKDEDNNYNLLDYSFLNGKFPPLNTTGKKGPIDGVLHQGTNMTNVYNLTQNFPKGFFKFKIRIRDEDGNFSNWTETTPIELGPQ